MKPLDYKGKWALITGASSGIGQEFAEQLARRGANVLLVARNVDKIRTLSESLRAKYAVKTEYISADLSQSQAPEELFHSSTTKGIKVDILVNNAGTGLYGKLAETDLSQNQSMLMLNVYSLATLTQLYLTDMIKQKSGAIVNIASTAAYQPVPYMSNYGASKAFVRSFSEALWEEYRKDGIRILTVCPGAVETNFFNAMGSRDAVVGAVDTAQNVVHQSLKALDKGKIAVIPGPVSNFIMSQASRFVSQALTAKLAGQTMKSSGA